MSDAEEDYLSDKFLAEAAAHSEGLTYAQRRREAQRKAEIKNVQNRKKSKRQLEEESRQEGLSKSLFERAKQEEETGSSVSSKAMAMMLKMGFKPGESLGRKDDAVSATDTTTTTTTTTNITTTTTTTAALSEPAPASAKPSGHLVEPLPLDVWSGRQGVGKRKRAASPTAAVKLAKAAQRAEEEARGSYRERVRQEYEERRAEGRLVAAIRTCVTLDEKDEIEYNILRLNPQDPENFPPELLEALASDVDAAENAATTPESSTETNDRLRLQMRAEALRPLSRLEDDGDRPSSPPSIMLENRIPPPEVKKAMEFLRLNARQRLQLLLDYMRAEYFYCFWCGTKYNDSEDLLNSCPGVGEDDHD